MRRVMMIISLCALTTSHDDEFQLYGAGARIFIDIDRHGAASLTAIYVVGFMGGYF